MLACICGGTLEVMLVFLGFGCLCKIFGRKGKTKCKCDHEEKRVEDSKDKKAQ